MFIDLPWFFSGVHLTNEVFDPQDQSADHGEETEEVSSVGQLLATALAQRLQLEPGIDHFSFPARDFAGFVTGIGSLQPRRIFLDALNLTMQRLKILQATTKPINVYS